MGKLELITSLHNSSRTFLAFPCTKKVSNHEVTKMCLGDSKFLSINAKQKKRQNECLIEVPGNS